MFKEIINNVKNKAPLVHNITNYVTVNDCANILLACGCSPIMADDILEVEEITSICNALVINVGTLNSRTIESMIAAGKKSNELNHPVILDPVGAGASKLRSDAVFRLLKEIKFTVIRGNISEIKTVYSGSHNTITGAGSHTIMVAGSGTHEITGVDTGSHIITSAGSHTDTGTGSNISNNTATSKGVDANTADAVTEDNLDDTIKFAKDLSKKTGAIIAITGAIDIITDGQKAYVIRNGHPLMSKITGAGCMLSSVIGAFCAANSKNLLDATATGVCAIGICGELAFEKMKQNNAGTSSLKMYLIDFMSKIDANVLKTEAKIESK